LYDIFEDVYIIIHAVEEGGSAFFEEISIWIRKRNGTSKNIFCIEDNENSRIFLKVSFPEIHSLVACADVN
jgi:hypothetical protein